MAILRFLGTGAGLPHPDRCSSSILIEGPYGGLLLDAGEGCARRLREEEQWNQEVRTVLITHNHADHLAGLPMLLMGLKGERRSKPLELIAPKGLREGISGFLPFIRLGGERLPFELITHELRPGTLTTASGHKMEVWDNDHLPSDEEGRGGSYSLAIEIDHERWVFSGDLGSLAPLEDRLEGAAGLVVETKHVDAREAVALALENGIGTILLTHIAENTPTPPMTNAIWAWDNLVVYTRDSGMES